MVIVIARLTQKIRPGMWDELDKIDKQFTEIENKLGYPPKKRYRALLGGNPIDTLIIDREWKSLAEMEKVMTKGVLDEDYQKLSSKLDDIIEWARYEIFVPHPPFPE
ncbi:MAG: hypothetical protein ACQERB_08590 [Promethearchaeati archaeon]